MARRPLSGIRVSGDAGAVLVFLGLLSGERARQGRHSLRMKMRRLCQEGNTSIHRRMKVMSEPKSKRWRVMADYCCGLWDDRGYGSGPDDEEINAPAAFVAAFDAWVDKYGYVDDDSFDVDSFDNEGRALAAALKQIVGPDVTVTFTPEKSFGDDYTGPREEEML